MRLVLRRRYKTRRRKQKSKDELAIELFYKRGFSIDEVAKKLKIKNKRVANRLKAGIKNVRNYQKSKQGLF